MTETKQRDWGKKKRRKKKAKDTEGGLRGIWGERIKRGIEKKKGWKSDERLSESTGGQKSRTVGYHRSQNRITEKFNFERASFLLAAHAEVCIHLPLKQAPELFSGQRGCTDVFWLLLTWTFVLACTRTDPVQMKLNNINQLNWQRPCFWELLFMVPDSRWCSVSWVLCSLIDCPPLLRLSN